MVYSALLANRQPRTQTKPYQRVVWLIAACIAWVGCKYAGARVIRATTVEAFVMPTDSMSKTILIGDYLLGEKVTYHFRSVRRGDVVIFESLESAQTSIVKRVIALPGETIEVRDNVVHINGQPLAEPYAHFAGNPPNRQRLVDFGPVTVPDGEVFMMANPRQPHVRRRAHRRHPRQSQYDLLVGGVRRAARPTLAGAVPSDSLGPHRPAPAMTAGPACYHPRISTCTE